MYCYCLDNPVNSYDPAGNACVSVINSDFLGPPVTRLNPEPTPEEQTYGVISGQALLPYADERIGLGTYGDNGCPYIAAYNALQLAGNGKPLSVVTNEIYYDYGSVLFGLWGVAPATLAAYLRDQGIVSVESANLNTLVEGVTEGSIITFTAWNRANNPFGGWHAMTALYSNGKYWVFNRYDETLEALGYHSLSNAIGRGELLYGVRIDPQ